DAAAAGGRAGVEAGLCRGLEGAASGTGGATRITAEAAAIPPQPAGLPERVGAAVSQANFATLEKNAGADVGPDGAAAGSGTGGATVEAGAGDRAGGVPRASERGRPEVARQDLAGQTPGREIPAAVEVALEPRTGVSVLHGP